VRAGEFMATLRSQPRRFWCECSGAGPCTSCFKGFEGCNRQGVRVYDTVEGARYLCAECGQEAEELVAAVEES
jgi:hypothetical protein